MANRMEIIRCDACGNVVEVLNGGRGELVCCGDPMKVMIENSVDAVDEKHVPVIEVVDGGVRVSVGDVAHPMKENHYIQWIAVLAGSKTYRQYLRPGEMPEAFFAVYAAELEANAYCNLHGLWKASQKVSG